MGFGKRKIPVEHAPDHPLVGEMPLGQLPLEKPKATTPPEPETIVDIPGDTPGEIPGEVPGDIPQDARPSDVDLDHYAPRDDGGPPRRRIIPASLWEGKQGDFLREIGASPDDEHNFVPDAHDVNQRIDRDKAAFEKKLEEMNRSVAERFPGATMRGFSLIPDPCWNGRTGKFLMLRLELFPYEDWNVVFLPTDEKTAEALNLPAHPGGDIPTFVEMAERFLESAQAKLTAAHDEAAQTHDFQGFVDARDDLREKVRGLARNFLGMMDEAWENRHG